MNDQPSCKLHINSSLILALWVSVPFHQTLNAQGWQFIGPDSSNWQSGQRITARFQSSTDYELAAMTWNGIATYSSAQNAWRYLNYQPPPGSAIGFCMISGMSLIIPPHSDSIVYASICGLYRSTNRGLVRFGHRAFDCSCRLPLRDRHRFPDQPVFQRRPAITAYALFGTWEHDILCRPVSIFALKDLGRVA